MDSVREYQVVMNQEEQYSVWPVDMTPLPNGWHSTGFQSTKERCLEHIREVWTDMRPLSLRRRVEHSTASPPSNNNGK